MPQYNAGTSVLSLSMEDKNESTTWRTGFFQKHMLAKAGELPYFARYKRVFPHCPRHAAPAE